MIAVVVGVCLALFIAAVVAIRLRGQWALPGTVGRALRWLGIATTAGIAVALLPITWSDSGSATFYLLGVPLIAAAATAIADLTGRAVGIVTTATALVILAWGLLLGLGYGVYFVVPALVLGVAALISLQSRTPARPAHD